MYGTLVNEPGWNCGPTAGADPGFEVGGRAEIKRVAYLRVEIVSSDSYFQASQGKQTN